MTFIEFLLQKRIKSETFQAEKPEMWHHFAQLFGQMGEKSFDAQKKFYFNPLRAEFPFSSEEIALIEETKKAAAAAKKIAAKPITPVIEKKEIPLEESAKKMPPKMKPVIRKEPILTETVEGQPVILPENEGEPAKKVPPKMKPIMRKENVSEEKVEEKLAILPENEGEPAKKVPPKMKPIMRKENVSEEKVEEKPAILPENEAEPLKKVPPKMKPIMKKTPPPNE